MRPAGLPDLRAMARSIRRLNTVRAVGRTCCCGGAPGRVYVEVKSVTLCRAGGQGLSRCSGERGRKHLRELQSVLAGDTRALLFFCVFHTGIRAVCAAGDIDPRYRDALAEAMAAGIEIRAWAADIDTAGISLAGSCLSRSIPRSIGRHRRYSG